MEAHITSIIEQDHKVLCAMCMCECVLGVLSVCMCVCVCTMSVIGDVSSHADHVSCVLGDVN